MTRGVERAPMNHLRARVLATYPHDRNAFTQGLALHDGLLYESTGRYGESEVRAVRPESGEAVQRVRLPDQAFGEGLAVVGDRVWQLTWREEYAFLRDRRTLAERARVRYRGQGWGLCYDPAGERLVMTDGTPRLLFRDPETFAPAGEVAVDGSPMMLNDLAVAGGRVWANVFPTDDIVGIDPDTGEVTATVDAAGLLPESDRDTADVLNGIAAVPGTDQFLITGKLWSRMFLVRFAAT